MKYSKLYTSLFIIVMGYMLNISFQWLHIKKIYIHIGSMIFMLLQFVYYCKNDKLHKKVNAYIKDSIKKYNQQLLDLLMIQRFFVFISRDYFKSSIFFLVLFIFSFITNTIFFSSIALVGIFFYLIAAITSYNEYRILFSFFTHNIENLVKPETVSNLNINDLKSALQDLLDKSFRSNDND